MFALGRTARRTSRIRYAPSRQSPNAAHAVLSNDDDDECKKKQQQTRFAHHHPSITARAPPPPPPPPLVSVREYHATSLAERSAPAAFLTLGAIAATAKAGQYAVQGYNEWKEASAREEEEEAKRREEEGETTSSDDARGTEEEDASKSTSGGDAGGGGGAGGGNASEEKRENIFANFFNMSVGSKYYEGGFEDVMTRKEAALILGVRESSAAKRIKEAHRKLLILNHPDTGGSTHLAGKINEAKELLLKGKKS